MIRTLAVLAGLAASVAVAPAPALAQAAWPGDKPVTLLVPFPPGGSSDQIARALAPKLQEKLGGSFVVDNKPGATGTIGAGMVKRAAPDGHTLFVSSLGTGVIPRARLAGETPPSPERLDYLKRVNAEHESIVDAIARQDPEAARAAMRTHLANSRERRRRAAGG